MESHPVLESGGPEEQQSAIAIADPPETPQQPKVRLVPVLKPRTTALVVALCFAGLTSAFSLLARARSRIAFERLLEDPSPQATRLLTDAQDLQGTAGVALGFSTFVVAVVLGMWLHRALRVRRAQGAFVMEPPMGGAAPFIPIANIAMPWVILRGLHHAKYRKSPSRGVGDPFAIAWWITFLVGFGTVIFTTGGPDASSGDLSDGATASVIGAALFVVAAVLGIISILRLHNTVTSSLDGHDGSELLQVEPMSVEETIASASDPTGPGPISSPETDALLTGTRAGVILAAGALIFTVAVIVIAPTTLASGDTRSILAGGQAQETSETYLLNEVPVGACLPLTANMSGEIIALATVVCTEPHRFEVVANLDLPQGLTAPYPGLTAVDKQATRLCLDEIDQRYGLQFEVDAFLPIPIVPVEQPWAQGSRGVNCLVELLDEISVPLTSADIRVSQIRNLTGGFGAGIGECANDSGALSLEIVPCGAQHDYEVFARNLATQKSSSHPGDDALLDETWEWCTGDLFQDYIGLSYDLSEFDVFAAFTTNEVFEFTDRIHRSCVLIVPASVTESLRSSAR